MFSFDPQSPILSFLKHSFPLDQYSTNAPFSKIIQVSHNHTEKLQALQARLRNQLSEIEEPFWDEFTHSMQKINIIMAL